MRYSREQLNELASKIDIVDYIGKTEELRRMGDKYFIKCPFHEGDNTPSLAIYPETNTWHCFGCGAGSTIYDWISQAEGKSFQEAVEHCASLTGSDVTNLIESESVTFLKSVKDMSKDCCLTQKREILDFNKDYLDKYSNELPQEWLSEDMTEEALRHYNIMIDNNVNRIVYPVFDADGNLIGVKGRTRLSTYKELGIAKYMNYNKIGALDYFQGWQQAEEEIKNTKSVIIFEGIKSCIKAYGWGIKNTVAAETSKISDGQLQLLIKNGLSEIIIAFDSDQSYKSIVTDSKIQMLKRFVNVSVITDRNGLLGEKMSPVDNGKDIFLRLYNERRSI